MPNAINKDCLLEKIVCYFSDEMLSKAQIASVLHENERQINQLVADLAKQVSSTVDL